jgi:hypothetical protein
MNVNAPSAQQTQIINERGFMKPEFGFLRFEAGGGSKVAERNARGKVKWQALSKIAT